MTVQLDLFLRFGVALAIGFMVGLQREFALGRAKRPISAGERTFALIGLLGCLAAMASDELGSPLPFIAVVFLFSLFTVVSYHVEAIKGKVGLTTEFAMAIVLLIGGLCYWNHLTVAAAIGIATTLVLSLKVETDRLVRALTREDILAALKFAVITAIVLPVLPDQSFLPPPFDVLNPFKIWLMVVFISGISYLGYVAIKIVGPEQGIGLTGLLGG
ncbi:MAG: MgtC/SapB family protein, partial [Anaerolineales bacterium]|nr:MgtC/SapB family protein [Anaerolineales bacterium]